MRKSWNERQIERLAAEKIKAEQRMKSRVLEAQATKIIKEGRKLENGEDIVQGLLYLEAGDE